MNSSVTRPHVIGFDDAPFEPDHRGDVLVVGAVYAGPRLDGVLSGKVRRDGVNSTRVIVDLVRGSRFFAQTHAVLLQGIAFAGFNVIDIDALNRTLELPVIVVVRKRPDLQKIETALLNHVPGGARKWKLIQKAGEIEPAGRLFLQRRGISLDAAERLLTRFSVNSNVPEPLRTAHLIAAGVARGESKHRV